MTIVIIEGTDLSGKTTAIDKIAKYFNSGFTLKNNFKPINKQSSIEIYEHYWKIISMILEYERLNPKELILLDRFYPSQAIYSYLRGKDELHSLEIMNLDNYCFDKNFKIIYINTEINEIIKRYKKIGDEYINSKCDLAIIKQRYDLFMAIKTENNPLFLDTMKKDWIKDVEEFLK